MSELICTGDNDTGTLRTAFAAGGFVRLIGTCKTRSTITISNNDLTVAGPATISSSGDPVFNITGSNIKFRDLVISGSGRGFTLSGGALRIFLTALQLNTKGDGIQMVEGAGLWARDLHFNGDPTNDRTYAVRGLDWDTSYFSDILVEEHWGGFRIGANEEGSFANSFFTNVVVDRCRDVAFQLEANDNGDLQNILMSNLWGSQGLWPMFVNGGETTGVVGKIIVHGGYFTDFANKRFFIGSNVSDFIYDHIIHQ